MAKTIEQNIQQELGALVYQILALQTQVDQLREENEALTKRVESQQGKKKAKP